tara:strand:+ start:44 stop:556 length:513 start_codon:yes stop_codon:yes gene_type:complete
MIEIIMVIVCCLYLVYLWGGDCYNFIQNKYEKVKFLNDIRKQSNISLVSSATFICKSIFTIVKVRIYMTLQKYILDLTITEVNTNVFEIQLVLKGKIIKMLLRVKRGPGSILQVSNGDSDDITDEVVPFYNYDVVGVNSNYFETTKLSFIKSDGEELVFSENEEIYTNLF